MSFFGKNIRKIRTVKNLSQQAFADVFDLKRGTLGAYEEGRSEPKIETIIKVANHFSIDIGALLTRELTVNELLKFKTDVDTLSIDSETLKLSEVPLITEKLQAEYLAYHDKSAFIAQMPRLKLPLDPEAKYLAYTVSNLEMSSNTNGFFPQDVVIGMEQSLQKLDALTAGSLVLLLTEDALFFRRLHATTESITLKADHPHISDITIKHKQVKALWLVCYTFLNRVPEINQDLDTKLSFLSQELQRIKDKLA